eukprot:TRINITY_DN2441_c0_g2_i1.p1 TRINITY_DN2441_c0_g2~~TRINITY_DN2441_c0_g2_i1.p1  ORF type:complete len:494 (-),score=140.11 TRINITY_DN2441_c0_g2_i1:325-1806(-)
MASSEVGVIGLGAMGSNFALLFASKKISVSIWNRDEKKVQSTHERAKRELKEDASFLRPFEKMEAFLKSLSHNPRKIFIVVTHGKAMDEILQQIVEHKILEKGDIVVDCGNEWLKDTNRRIEQMAKHGIEFMGMGLSGGYQSARRGPSMTAGGGSSKAKSFDRIRDILETIAPKGHVGPNSIEPSKDHAEKVPCIAYFGAGASGQYVKMVHNGIEQAMMGVMSDIYFLMRNSLHMSNKQISDTFREWLRTRKELTNNFLIEISVEICERTVEEADKETRRVQKKSFGKEDDKKESTDGREGDMQIDDVADRVLQDAEGSEGTGYWTVSEAALRHVPCNAIAASHFLRVLSSDYRSRARFAELSQSQSPQSTSTNSGEEDRQKVLSDLADTMIVGFIVSFAQGMDLLIKAAAEEDWLSYEFINNAFVTWKAGCIIRSEFIIDLLQVVYRDRHQADPSSFTPKAVKTTFEKAMARPNLLTEEKVCYCSLMLINQH